MKRLWNFVKSWWRLWLSAFLGTIVIAVVFNTMWGDPNLSYAMVAVGTLLLAIVTAAAIDSNRQIAKQRREEELARERRERDKELLNDIIEWAIDTVKIGTPAQSAIIIAPIHEESDRRLILNTLIGLSNDFRVMIARSLYVCRIGLAFGEELRSSIDKLDKNLREQTDLTARCLKIVIGGDPSKFDKAWDELIDNWEKLGESAANVIDEAIIEKFTILNM